MLNEIKKEDIFKFKNKINLLLLDDLIVRSHYSKGRIEGMLKFDNTLIEALKLLSNKKQYNTILSSN